MKCNLYLESSSTIQNLSNLSSHYLKRIDMLKMPSSMDIGGPTHMYHNIFVIV
jgi:hypothetical protein